MQNFREKYAYKISLYLAIFLPLYFFISVLFQVFVRYGASSWLLDVDKFAPIVFFLFLIAFIIRLFSLYPVTRWADIFFSVLCTLIYVQVEGIFGFFTESYMNKRDLILCCILAIPSILIIKYLLELRKRENLIKE